MDSINKRDKIVKGIAIALFVLVIVGFIIGMYAMYQKLVVGFEPDSGDGDLDFSEIVLDVPNYDNIIDRIPEINYAYADEGDVAYVLSDRVKDLDPSAKAVPMSRYSTYYEFWRSEDKIILSDYRRSPTYIRKWKSLNLIELIFGDGDGTVWHELELNLLNLTYTTPIRDQSGYLPPTGDYYSFRFYYYPLFNIFASGYSDRSTYKYGDLRLVTRGSGCILKLVNEESGEYVLQGGFDLSKIISDELIHDVSSHPADTSYPDKYNLLSLYYGDAVTGLKIEDRAIWDPDNQYSDYDSAYFYSYGDSYFELICDFELPYYTDTKTGELIYSSFTTYTRFRIF